MSRKLDSIFPRGTIRQPSGSHIGREVALVTRTAAFVYTYARIPQIAEMTLSFHATKEKQPVRPLKNGYLDDVFSIFKARQHCIVLVEESAMRWMGGCSVANALEVEMMLHMLRQYERLVVCIVQGRP